jgi:seryl-tRNA synthetase
MFAFGTPLMSEELHEEMLKIEQEMFDELGLYYQVLDMPTDDLGAPAYRKYDIEAWIPSRKGFGEISSTSNCTDYQSRRLNIRFKPEGEKENKFVHTINGTACAVPRVLLAILENNQQEDGTIDIPAALQPYVGLKKIVPHQKHNKN